MFVIVSASSAGAGTLDAYTDNNATPTTIVSEHDHANAGIMHISFMVLSGNYYMVQNTGSTLAEWTEWS